MIPDATALRDFADIAVAAGTTLLEARRQPMAVELKADGSPVTAADRAANAVILQRLAERFPGIAIVSEESAPSGGDKEGEAKFFLVDPLDGTKEFIAGNDEFAVNIALIVGDEPAAGVVHCPALGVLYSGGRGHSALRMRIDGGKIGTPEPIKAAPVTGALRVVTSRSHLNAETSAFINRYPVSTLHRAGSSLKFCLVAAGEADLYPRLDQTMEWDTAAGDAVLRAAGGSVRTLDGRPLRYGKRGEAGLRDFANPSFVAAGAFDPFDPRLRKGGAA